MRALVTFMANTNTTTTKRDRLFGIIADGRRHSMAKLEKRLDSPSHSIRGRLSELRNETGYTITNSNGFVQLSD